MSYRVEFSVEGLAGRKDTYARRLNRDVNIFFGSNGSGKTSLLKILHSAFDGNSAVLKNVPFHAAEVKFYSKALDRVFTRTAVQKSDPLQDPSTTGSGDMVLDGSRAAAATSGPVWTATPEIPQRVSGFHHRYLPTSRLYLGTPGLGLGTPGLGLEPPYPTIASAVRAFGRSEDSLDQQFAQSLTTSWTSYAATVSKEVRDAQQKGLANILREALLGSPEEHSTSIAPDPRQAYQRVASFLSRQVGFADALGPEEHFARKYLTDALFQNVVKDIEEVEQSIEAVTARGERLKSLVNSMFGGNKGVVFSDTSVEVRIGQDKTIGLPFLSSGEKQLLYMFVDTLLADVSSILVDEPEISMHVDWQKALVKSMQTLNPDAQIIMATHSPEIMADTADDKIFRL